MIQFFCSPLQEMQIGNFVLTVDSALLMFLMLLLGGPGETFPVTTEAERVWWKHADMPLISPDASRPPEEQRRPTPQSSKGSMEEPLILLENESWIAMATARASPQPRPGVWFPDDEPNASPRPRPRPRLDREFTRPIEDWTPRTKRAYMREQRSARLQDELQSNARKALEDIGYWNMLKSGIDTVADSGGWPFAAWAALSVPSPSPSPSSVHTELDIGASWVVPLRPGERFEEWLGGGWDGYDAEPGLYPRAPEKGEDGEEGVLAYLADRQRDERH